MPRLPPRHRSDATRSQARVGSLADVLEPEQVQDFAFADTVVVNDDPHPPPPSGPIYTHDSMGNLQCMTPLAFPLPPAAENVATSTKLRVLAAHVRHAVRGSLEEMSELWDDTDGLVERRDARQLRRIVALWSSFHWSRTDLMRAALIGLAVFVATAAIGTTTLGLGASTQGASSPEVRLRRTLDQHTGKKIVARSKR